MLKMARMVSGIPGGHRISPRQKSELAAQGLSLSLHGDERQRGLFAQTGNDEIPERVIQSTFGPTK
jgi:hypothetical protein